jgi:hypothetical protein
MMLLTLSAAELVELTGYRQPAAQLAELRRQGFHRARRLITGGVVLERAHYDAVCAGRDKPADAPKLRPPRLKAAA